MGAPAVNGERGRALRERLVAACYRFLEQIDGEKGCRLVPYKVVQPWKMQMLEIL